MPLTPDAREVAQRAARTARAALKDTYRERLARLQAVVDPPLSAAELSAGLGLEAPERGVSPVSRWLSSSARLARSAPDTDTRALIDAVLAGSLHVAVQRGLPPGRRRQVLLCTDKDLPWLASHLRAYNLAGRDLVDVGTATTDWDDGSLWDPFAESAVEVVRGGAAGATRRFLDRDVTPLVLGTLRLGTVGRPDRPEAIRLLRAAVDAGVGVVDLADTYAGDDTERGYIETLYKETLQGRDALAVTKVGLCRPGGAWRPAGRPEQLVAAAEASARRLGSLPLLMLHAPDPSVPWAEQVGALASLVERGIADNVGLCNVSTDQLVEARGMIEVAAVQVAASWFSRRALEEVVVRCVEAGIPVMAHSPLGGHARRGRAGADRTLMAVASRHGVSAEQVALAWLLSLSDGLLPVVGSTRLASLADSLAATELALSEEDLGVLGGDELQQTLARARPPLPNEVVVLMGPPASGKTSRVGAYTRAGYLRLNRDERGGALDDLLPALREGLQAAPRRVVLDNTYPSRRSRRGVLAAAADAGVEARAVWLDVPLGDALVNAAGRILDRLGELPGPKALAVAAREDPNLLPPAAIYRWFERFEAPTTEEGFARVEVVPFMRRIELQATGRAVFFDLDGTLRRSKAGGPFPTGAADVELLPARREVLGALAKAGWMLVGVTNQGGIARGQLDEAAARAAVDETVRQLGQDLDVRLCPHGSTDGCWCRKPMPGLGVQLLRAHDLDPRRCHMVGDMASDRGFATHLGLRFHDAEDFFAVGWQALVDDEGSDPIGNFGSDK